MVSEAAGKARVLRVPGADALTAALREVAVFKAPGFYTLDTDEAQVVREADALQVRPPALMLCGVEAETWRCYAKGRV